MLERPCTVQLQFYRQTASYIVANIHHYMTKNQRYIRSQEKTLGWARILLKDEEERKQKALESSGKEVEPHMLHLVHLVKPLRGRPWWEKKIAKELQIEKPNQPVILKNVPSVNLLLDEIKHLLLIQPLRFPHGIPEHESDFEHTLINTRGEMLVRKRLKDHDPHTELTVVPAESMWTLSSDTVKNDLNRKLVDYSVHSEFFKPAYKYKRNQDNKEYRYTFNKDVPKYAW